MNEILIPQTLHANLSSKDELKWLSTLPTLISKLANQWALTLGEPFGAEASCSWVAPCTRADGSNAVLKVGLPHMEAKDEIEGMRFWHGDPTAYLLDADKAHNALLLERCIPGTVLRTYPEEEQDVVIAQLLRRLWRSPAASYKPKEQTFDPQMEGEGLAQADFTFRPLSEMVAYWIEEAEKRSDEWLDPTIVQAGIQVYEELVESTTEHMLLATDLHAGNVLRAARAPWLVIDPKPFVGDPAYDATQHLFNCWRRMESNPLETIDRFAALLEVDAERVKMWFFARLATGSERSNQKEKIILARTLAP